MRTGRRWILGAATVLALTPVGALAVGMASAPAEPAVDAFNLYALSGSARSVMLGGDLGAGGGLVTFDQGVPMVQGAVDSGPSATARASYLDSGVLPSTLAGVANNSAGSPILAFPNFVDAAYPGSSDRQDPPPASVVARQEMAPFVFEGGGAEAHAKEGRAIAGAGWERFSVADVTAGSTGGAAEVRASNQSQAMALSRLRRALDRVRKAYPYLVTEMVAQGDEASLLVADDLAAYLDLSGDQKTGKLTGRVDSTTGHLSLFGGQIFIASVEAHATLASDGSEKGRKALASVAVGDMSIGGIPVKVGPDGVEIAGTPAASGDMLAQAADALNEALGQAQVEITAPQVTSLSDPGSRGVITNALVISITTPGTPGGEVASNRLKIFVGHVEADVTDSLASPVPQFDEDEVAAGDTGGSYEVSGAETLAVEGGTTSSPAGASPGSALTSTRLVSHSNRRVLFMAFGLWQALSLSGLTAAALLASRKSKPWELS
ncbi:MAG: hypothetical protein WDA71_03215 [Actinomycetota bacterium]